MPLRIAPMEGRAGSTPADVQGLRPGACPVCDAVEWRLLQRGRDEFGDLWRCTGCDLARLFPTPRDEEYPDELKGMYEREATTLSESRLALARRSVAGYLGALQALGVRPLTMVDLGGGLGYYSRAFAEAGLRVTYVDNDAVSAAFVPKTHPQVQVRQSPIEAFLEGSRERFDLVFCRHVIEHSLAPDRTLSLMRNICGADTWLLLETDNNNGVEMFFHPDAAPYWRGVYRDHYGISSFLRLLRLRPLALDRTETHYYGFRPDNLRRLMERGGWDVQSLILSALGDPTYWPNMTPAARYPWWRPRFNVRRWMKEATYRLILPWLQKAGLVSSIAVYARYRQAA